MPLIMPIRPWEELRICSSVAALGLGMSWSQETTGSIRGSRRYRRYFLIFIFETFLSLKLKGSIQAGRTGLSEGSIQPDLEGPPDRHVAKIIAPHSAALARRVGL